MFKVFHRGFSGGGEYNCFFWFCMFRTRIFLFPLKKKMCSVWTRNSLTLVSPAFSQKATKKTDKPRPEEKDDLDITELSNEDLQEQLVKYGLNPGPIVGRSTELVNIYLINIFLTKPQFWVLDASQYSWLLSLVPVLLWSCFPLKILPLNYWHWEDLQNHLGWRRPLKSLSPSFNLALPSLPLNRFFFFFI